jgi:hypothetical protein
MEVVPTIVRIFTWAFFEPKKKCGVLTNAATGILVAPILDLE